MPFFKTYKGEPVVHMKRVGSLIQITFANAVIGDRKQRIEITQEEWDAHGTSKHVEKLPDLREMRTPTTLS